MASKSGEQVNQAPTLLKNRRLVASADIRLPSSLQQDPSLASSKGGLAGLQHQLRHLQPFHCVTASLPAHRLLVTKLDPLLHFLHQRAG